MKLLDLFDGRDKKKRLSHVRNLVALAFVDGSFDEIESKLIVRIATKAGLNESEVKRIANRPESIEFHVPTKYEEKVEQLCDMVLIMMADGEMHREEIIFCKGAAAKLGFKHNVIDVIVKGVMQMMTNGLVTENALLRLRNNMLLELKK